MLPTDFVRSIFRKPWNRFKAISFLFMVVVACAGVSCKPKYRRQTEAVTHAYPDQESIYRSNQKIIKQNIQAIRDKALQQGWTLSETGTGVFYQRLLLPGSDSSVKIEKGDRVSLKYRVSLLDGTVCYSSDEEGPKQFIVEKSEAEPGLHEAIQFLHPGDSAVIVIPPHRAFGLTGDGDKIPPRAILVYEIRIDSVAGNLDH